jgi:hypothetical protein
MSAELVSYARLFNPKMFKIRMAMQEGNAYLSTNPHAMHSNESLRLFSYAGANRATKS